MNCSELEEIVHELDRPGTAGFAARDAAFAHAESCDHCTALLTQSEALDFALRAISQGVDQEQTRPRIEAALLSEFRRRNAPASRNLKGWYIAALGTAAAALLAVSLAFHNRTAGKQLSTAQSAGISAPQPSGQHTSSAAPAQSAAAPQTEVADNQAPDSESEMPFVALPYADDAMASEGGTVVRVILSRPALASLGMPVTDIGAGDRIPADILVSEDGAPQAIRLVANSDLQ